jgi:hypothetical protein
MEIKIVKFKVRRGTNDQRKVTIFDQGELVHTLDNKRLYVGNGVSVGGEVIGSKIFTPVSNPSALLSLEAEVGDIAPINNIFYQLTAQPSNQNSNWVAILPNSSNFIAPSSLSASQINPLTVSGGLKIENNFLQTRLNSKQLEISAFDIAIKSSGIDEREISSSSFSDGIIGGSGDKISLNVDTTYFNFDTGKLTMSSDFASISAFKGVDNITITSLSGIISQTILTEAGYFELPAIEIDDYGRVVEMNSSIGDILSAIDFTNTTFNGTPSHTIEGPIPTLPLNIIEALSADSLGNLTTVMLSSAGFLAFNGNSISRSGRPVGRIAIPVFTF